MKSIRDILYATQRGGVFLFNKICKSALTALLVLIMTTTAVTFLFSKPVLAEEIETDEIVFEEADWEENLSEEAVYIDVGNAENSDDQLVVTKKIMHRHTGTTAKGGGCHNIPVITYQAVEVRCPGTLYYWGDDWGTSECTACGASYTGNRGGEQCPHTTTETREVTVYDIGCGKTGKVVGYVTYKITPTTWTQAVDIDISIENIGMKLGASPYNFNGVAYSDGHFTVEENGSYILGIFADDNSNVTPAAYRADINNIDRTGPELISYGAKPIDWTVDGVTVTLDRVVDHQPDGSNGCGLADKPYSFDGGETWTDWYEHWYTENGNHELIIRDKLGNEKINYIYVGNIDREPPNIVSVNYDHGNNIKETDVTVICDDILSDGREGCGLDEVAYSFDNGESWVSSNTIHITKNCTIDLWVRDRLWNSIAHEIVIDNLDDECPEVCHTMTPDDWTNGNVKVTFSAKDINSKGEAGVGLPIRCFSYDGGKTWTDNPSIEVENNGRVNVMVRDLNDNNAYYNMEVAIIDRIPPQVTLAYEYIEDTNEVELVAKVWDEQSGIREESAIWKGGNAKHGGTTYSVTTEGSYSFEVSDKAGNETRKDIDVKNIPSPPDYPDDEDDEVVYPFPIVEEVIQAEDEPYIPVERIVSTSDDLEELIEESSEEERVIEEIVLEQKEEAEEKTISDGNTRWWDGLSGLQKLLFFSLLLVMLILLILLLLLYYRSVVIMCERKHNDYAVLGIKLIKEKNGHYYLDVDENIWNEAESTHFAFRFNILFAWLHRSEDIYINFPKEQVRMTGIGRKSEVIV